MKYLNWITKVEPLNETQLVLKVRYEGRVLVKILPRSWMQLDSEYKIKKHEVELLKQLKGESKWKCQY